MSDKSTLTQLRERLQDEIALRQRQLGFIDALAEKLGALNLPMSIGGANSLDFDYLPHSDVTKVIRTIGGKWKKEPADNGKVHYTQQMGPFEIRCYAGDPPPNCKVVEVEELIPAQPARVVKRKKMVCTQAEPEAPLRKLVLDDLPNLHEECDGDGAPLSE